MASAASSRAATNVVDAHVHLVGDPGRYPLKPTSLPGDAWYREAPVNAAQFTDLMATAGVGRAVLVQPVGAYGDDNSYLLEAAARSPDRFAAVCMVDPAGPAPASALRRHVYESGASGVRLFAVHDPHQSVDAPHFLPLWQEAARLGIPVVVTIWGSQLPGLGQMLHRFAGLRVALDHCAFPAFDGSPNRADVESLLALSTYPALALKVSSFVIDACTVAGVEASAFVARLVSEFGAERVMWGSDFPQTHDRSYAELVDTGRRAAAGLDERARAEFLRYAAERLWWPDG
jgi:predicted TIM-barrel fold metal-dependent hydrolase